MAGTHRLRNMPEVTQCPLGCSRMGALLSQDPTWGPTPCTSRCAGLAVSCRCDQCGHWDRRTHATSTVWPGCQPEHTWEEP